MSYFSTERSAQSTNNVQLTYADILYDHAGFLRKYDGLLGPAGAMNGKNVAVVGAGPAGMCAAYLLDQQGANVTIFEASSRIGGRVYSYEPIPGDGAIFEMGAMRVPPSEQIFGYFTEKFGVHPGGQFPDPGKVDTSIIFQNQTYDWPKGGTAPSIFDNVSKGWGALAGSWMNEVGNYLMDPSDFPKAKANWQKLIYPSAPLGPEQGYSTISFFQGLVQAFVENASKWGCDPWSVRDFSLFGALGLGSGGFGPLYQVNFAEIARLVVNGLETDQKFYPGGLDALIAGFKNGLTNSSIKTNCKVIAVEGTDGSGSRAPVGITYQPGSSSPVTGKFDAAIIATTTRSMQVDMALTDPIYWKPPLPETANTAIRELHLMNSSKLFVLTKTKFWEHGNYPANIQTDGLCRGLYCLDYPSAGGYGVVLISYTWGDDSTKYIALKDPAERLEILLQSLTPGAQSFVTKLRSEIMPQYTKMVDWQDESQYYGAFKLNYPGQDPRNRDLYYHFLNAQWNGVFLAGDSVGWCGGWIEGALQTGVNAAAGVVGDLTGYSGIYRDGPLSQSSDLYDYGP